MDGNPQVYAREALFLAEYPNAVSIPSQAFRIRNLLTRRTTEKALAWIKEKRESPFFLHFSETMPGSTAAPFASPEFNGKSRSGPWKLFLPLESFVRHPHFKNGPTHTAPLLFNVYEDIGSTQNVAEENPDIVARLTSLAEPIRRELGDREAPGPGIRRIGKFENPVPLLKE